ncbi:MAG TPA: RNA 2',3'-cyclic phosphodiesterase, partial [Bdellovibrio sp.]|nr:RNA 2',3'-cyclic phosphodiesterase [Bdellovibrio sp.]
MTQISTKSKSVPLFFALNATDPLQTTFLLASKKLRINADQKEMTVKWVPLENFHVTVTFLGNRSAEEVPQLEEVLKNVCARFTSFDLKVEDVGAFASEHEARVLWLGVQNKK